MFFSVLISGMPRQNLWTPVMILPVLTFKLFGLRDFWKAQDWVSPMWSGPPENLKERAGKSALLTNMSANLGPAKINGEHRYFFSLADLQALTPCSDAVWFLGAELHAVSFITWFCFLFPWFKGGHSLAICISRLLLACICYAWKCRMPLSCSQVDWHNGTATWKWQETCWL